MQKYKKESIYIIFSPIFSAYLSYSGRHIKLLPFQGARRGDMNTQGECPGLGASALSGREGNGRRREGNGRDARREWQRGLRGGLQAAFKPKKKFVTIRLGVDFNEYILLIFPSF